MTNDYKPITVYTLSERIDQVVARLDELERAIEELGAQWEEVEDEQERRA